MLNRSESDLYRRALEDVAAENDFEISWTLALDILPWIACIISIFVQLTGITFDKIFIK